MSQLSSINNQLIEQQNAKIQQFYDILSELLEVTQNTTILTGMQNNDLEVALQALLNINNFINPVLSRLETVSENNREIAVQFGNTGIQTHQQIGELCTSLYEHSAQQIVANGQVLEMLKTLAMSVKSVSDRVEKLERPQLGAVASRKADKIGGDAA
jgi:hypothetical protein